MKRSHFCWFVSSPPHQKFCGRSTPSPGPLAHKQSPDGFSEVPTCDDARATAAPMPGPVGGMAPCFPPLLRQSPTKQFGCLYHWVATGGWGNVHLSLSSENIASCPWRGTLVTEVPVTLPLPGLPALPPAPGITSCFCFISVGSEMLISCLNTSLLHV